MGLDDWATFADWTPPPDHDAFPGVLNGGIVSALLDCHGNWTAATHLMRLRGVDVPPTTVTADLHVTLLQAHAQPPTGAPARARRSKPIPIEPSLRPSCCPARA